MANSTDEWWDIDGVSLHQYGWSVATVGGGRYDLPPRRGENITLAYQPGQTHRNKLPDARVITLVMWLTGADPATGDAVADPVLQWNDSWDFLRRLVWTAGGTQVTLTRRWRLTANGVPQIVLATGLAEIADTMTPTMSGRTRAEFTMTLVMADPFFYGQTIETPIDMDSGGAVIITNPGHDYAMHAGLGVALHGPMTNPILTNYSVDPPVWVRFNGDIADGDMISLDVGAFTATDINSGTNVLGSVSFGGARYWMALAPGDNTLVLTSDFNTGSATVAFQPPYI